MKHRFGLTALPIAAGVLLVFVAAETVAARSGDPKLDRAIEKANSDYVEAMKTGDAAAIAAPYTDDAVFVGIDGACTRGRSEIEKMYRARFERSGLAKSTRIDSKRLVVDGNLAYESGYGEIGRLREGKLVVDGGRFLTVWQRQPDGEWKILRNIVLPDDPRRKSDLKQVDLTDLGTRYAAAWSSQDPALLASFYADNGTLTVNGDPPSVGRAAVTATARAYMTAFPDMVVKMTRMSQEDAHPVFHWLWTGTNTGPGGTGKSVRLTGYEEWTLDSQGRIVESKGHYDDAEYQRQLKAGAPPSP